MKRLNEAGLRYIMGWEKLRLKVYDDGYGNPTIGYGHLVDSFNHPNIDKSIAIEWLKNDVEIAECGVDKLVTVQLNQNQYNVLVSIIFNVGVGRFAKSKLRKLINSGASPKEVGELIKHAFITSNGIQSNGLIERRKSDAELYTKEV